MSLRIGLDVGGTFTDLTAVDLGSGRLFSRKQRSNPEDPAAAILEGTAALLAEAGRSGEAVSFFGHGTTVVTNRIVERKGARLGIVTTKGFRDVLELARQARPHVYDYTRRRPPPLAARRHRFEIAERMAPDGSVLLAPDLDAVEGIALAIEAARLEAVAVCFLHAYANGENERAVAAALRAALPDIYIATSHEIAPEYREFERFSTAALNGFVGPGATSYFQRLQAGLTARGIEAPLYTVTSNGGLIDLETASAGPVRTALSGPAAGVSGIGRLLAHHGLGDLVTFDVGGTSTDVAILSGGKPRPVRAREVAGYPVLAPMIDIEVIGAGGGSLARVDAGGALSVGPQSAGAIPGPVAYGRGGTTPTLTDAALVLGRLDPDTPLGGALRLDRRLAREAIGRSLASPLGMDPEAAAEGVLRIAAANMARTIRSVASARGFEASRLTLVGYGGAGPLVAADVAAVLGMTRFVVPSEPGTLCARAMLVGDLARDFSTTRVTTLDEAGWELVCQGFTVLREAGRIWLEQMETPEAAWSFEQVIEARYAGQNFELAVPVAPDIRLDDALQSFAAIHRTEQGYLLENHRVEAVTLRLKAVAAVGSGLPRPAEISETDPTRPAMTRRPVWFAGAAVETSIVPREALRPGEKISGPAVLPELTATTVLPPGWQAHVLGDRTLLAERVSEAGL